MRKDFKLTHRKGRFIQVCFAYNPSRWISTGTHDKTEAIVWATQHLGAGMPDSIKDKLTLENFARPFVDNDFKQLQDRDVARGKIIGSQKYANIAALIQRYIIPAQGKFIIKHITSTLVEDWLVQEKDITNCTKNSILYAYKLLLNEAIRAGVIVDNPIEKIPPFAYHSKEKECFTLTELNTLFPQDKDELIELWGGLMWATYFCILRDTGFRPGEVAGLSPSCINKDGGVYTEQSINPVTHLLQESIKTTHKGQAYKIGYLSQQTLNLVNELKQTDRVKKFNLLFTVQTKSLYITTASGNAQLKKVCEKINLDLGKRTLYSFRHTFNTMIFNKVDEKTRLELMGHTANVKTYDHRTAEDRLKNLTTAKNTIENLYTDEVV